MSLIATESIEWHEALNRYRYPVNLKTFSGRIRFGPNWFKWSTETGDRTETTQFEQHFCEHAASSLEAWYEVVFWKMASQGGRADIQTERTIVRIAEEMTSASRLWLDCAAYIQSETIESFSRFQHLLVKSGSLAVAFTFPAFCCPNRFPMVDTRVARYIASEGLQHGFPSTPEIERTLKRYRTTKAGGVLTLSDWPFVEAWVEWCRKKAEGLSAQGDFVWRPRDVEMAVFNAWGERQERKNWPEGKSRYRLL
jgi:hypothetical protein